MDALIGKEPRATRALLSDSTQALLVAALVALDKQLLTRDGYFKGSLRSFMHDRIGVERARARTISFQLVAQGLTAPKAETDHRPHAKFIETAALKAVLRGYFRYLAEPTRLTSGAYATIEAQAEALCERYDRSGPRIAALAYVLSRRRKVILPHDEDVTYSSSALASLGEHRAVVDAQCVFEALIGRTSADTWSSLPWGTRALILAALIATAPERYCDKSGYLKGRLIAVIRETFGETGSLPLKRVGQEMARLGLIEWNGWPGPNSQVRIVSTTPRLASVLQDFSLWRQDPSQLSLEVYAKLEEEADKICVTLNDLEIGELAYMLAKLARAVVHIGGIIGIMTHYSVVTNHVFIQIQKGVRVIEPRLNDKAHRAIRPGDLVVVTNRETNEQVVTKVVGILRYASFMELVQAYPPARFGVSDERDILTEMRRYYTNDQEIEHGVVGIKLHVLSSKKETHGN